MTAKTRNLLWFTYLAVILCWQLNAFGSVLQMMNSRELYINETKDPPGVSDFLYFYTAGAIARSPQRAQAYNPELQHQVYEQVVQRKIEQIAFIQYTPFMFIFTSPFTFLPLNWAWLLWSLIGIACAICGLAVLLSDSEKSRPKIIGLLIAFIATCPDWSAFRSGQFAWFLMAIYSIYAFSFLKRQDILCGVMLALSTAKPQYTMLMAIPVLARRRFKTIIAAAVTELVLLVGAGLVLGFPTIVNYPAAVLHAESNPHVYGADPQLMTSIRGLLTTFQIPQPQILTVCFALSLVLCCAIMWIGTETYRTKAMVESDSSSEDADRWLLSLAIIGALTLSPHAHMYDLTLISVIGALTVPPCLAHWKRLPARILAVIILAYPIISWLLFLIAPITFTAFALLNLVLLIVAIYFNRYPLGLKAQLE
ncbi:MAG TPA: glycosyltransferase family 87 protein [Drouetiella sp.]